MGVTVEVDDSTNLVTSAKCSAVMFRGFETIVLGRDPRDCAPILSAICGVCHSDHHINSVRAIENAAGMTSYPGSYAYEQTTIPKNAVLSRNIIQGADWSYSHAAHLLALAGPDYELYDLLQVLSQSVLITNYADLLKYAVIPAQAYMHQLITLWGGKTPHQRASIPGGNPVRPTSDVIEQSIFKVSNLRSILDDVVPVVWNFLTADAARLGSLGPGPGNFLSLGAFPDPTTTNGISMMPLVLPRGVITSPGTTPAPFDPTQMTETVPYSWYNQPLSSEVIGEQTPVPDQTNPDAYSWSKSPRYQGNPMEVGPLARVRSRDLSEARAGHQQHHSFGLWVSPQSQRLCIRQVGLQGSRTRSADRLQQHTTEPHRPGRAAEPLPRRRSERTQPSDSRTHSDMAKRHGRERPCLHVLQQSHGGTGYRPVGSSPRVPPSLD